MSRIGRQPILVSEGVEVSIVGNLVTVKGPKGELRNKVLKGFEVTQKDNLITVAQKVINPDTQKQFGLQRTLIANMIIGRLLKRTRNKWRRLQSPNEGQRA